MRNLEFNQNIKVVESFRYYMKKLRARKVDKKIIFF